MTADSDAVAALLASPFHGTGFADKYGHGPQTLECTIGAFLDLLEGEGAAPPIGEKDGPGYVPAKLRNLDLGKKDANVESVYALVIDQDDCAADGVDAILTKLSYYGLAHTTYNHTPEAPRFRIIIAFTRPVTVEEFDRLWAWANELTGSDTSGRNEAHFYYLPRVPDAVAQGNAWVRRLAGPPLDPDEVLASLPPQEPRKASDSPPGPSRRMRFAVSIHYGIDLLGLTVAANGNVQCPDHVDPEKHHRGDQNPSAGLHDEDHLHCYACKGTFDIVDLVQRALGSTFQESVEHLREVESQLNRIKFDPNDLPEFPVTALPPICAAMATEISETVQIDAAVPAMTMLGLLGAIAGGIIEVQIGRTHKEIAALWALIALPSGERKTAGQELVLGPLREKENEWLVSYKLDLKKFEVQHAAHAQRVATLQKELTKSGDPQERGRLIAELESMAILAPEFPPSPELIVQDATPEAVARKMSMQGDRSFLVSDEGGPFATMRGRYTSRGFANLDIFLKGHAGSPCKVDRADPGKLPVSMDRPVINMAFAIQPFVLNEIVAAAEMKGTGFLARILYSVPRSLTGTRMYQDRPIDPSIENAYGRAVKSALRHQERRGEKR